MAKILIVEDDPYVRRFYERILKFSKFTVETADDGVEAIEKAKATKPNLVLLDIMMPKMNGLQVLEKLKADPETKDLMVVMLTNLGDDETIRQSVVLGASGFIVKSNTEPELLENEISNFLHN